MGYTCNSISVIIKYKWNKLVECGVYLLFTVKVKCDSYCKTYKNSKMWLFLYNGDSIFIC